MDANKPKLPIAVPVRSRHALDAIGRRSHIKEFNSVALPGVDLVEETDLIRRGYGEPLGNDRWRINGRIYVREGNPQGTLFPESGPSIIRLDRAAFKALTIVVRYNGYTMEAAYEMAQAPDVGDNAIAIARDLYEQRTKRS